MGGPFQKVKVGPKVLFLHGQHKTEQQGWKIRDMTQNWHVLSLNHISKQKLHKGTLFEEGNKKESDQVSDFNT